MSDPQANAVGTFVRAPGVRHKLIGSPVILSDTSRTPTRGAPMHGEHTARLLAGLGCSPEQLEQLVQREQPTPGAKGKKRARFK